MKKSELLEKIAPYLVLVSFVLVFFIGFNWQNIASLSKNSIEASPAPLVDSPKLTDNDLKKYAKNIGLDTDKFNACLDSDKYEDKISNDIAYADELGVSGTPGFLLNGHYIDGTLSYADFKAAIDFELNGGDWTKAPTSITNNVNITKGTEDVTDGQIRGDKNAKVKFVEFSDFECIYCRQFFREAEPQIMKEYVDTGKVLFVFKNYPIFLAHPHAVKAAEAGECAAEQGKFWEMHDAMLSS